MSIRRYKPEQDVNLLRQIEVEIANGKTTPETCRDAGIKVQTYYRWRKEYGGPKLDQAKRLKEREKENSRLKRLGTGMLYIALGTKTRAGQGRLGVRKHGRSGSKPSLESLRLGVSDPHRNKGRLVATNP